MSRVYAYAAADRDKIFALLPIGQRRKPIETGNTILNLFSLSLFLTFSLQRSPLFFQDIIELPEKVKAINIIAYSVGADLYCASLRQEGPERHRLCTMAIDYLKPVLCSTPNDARALCLMAQHLNMIRERESADKYYARAVAVIILFSFSYCFYFLLFCIFYFLRCFYTYLLFFFSFLFFFFSFLFFSLIFLFFLCFNRFAIPVLVEFSFLLSFFSTFSFLFLFSLYFFFSYS